MPKTKTWNIYHLYTGEKSYTYIPTTTHIPKETIHADMKINLFFIYYLKIENKSINNKSK